ncbi:MAG: glycoside hydrolase family 15 protein [Nitrososphaerales archaeon]
MRADDPKVEGTMKQIEENLTVRTSVGGLARYSNDRYQEVKYYDASIPGNPWFVTTLWLADWYIERSRTRNDLARAKELIEWATSHSLPSGIMAEQLNPFDGSPLSVSPHTWSHGTFIESVNRYARKYAYLPQG